MWSNHVYHDVAIDQMRRSSTFVNFWESLVKALRLHCSAHTKTSVQISSLLTFQCFEIYQLQVRQLILVAVRRLGGLSRAVLPPVQGSGVRAGATSWPLSAVAGWPAGPAGPAAVNHTFLKANNQKQPRSVKPYQRLSGGMKKEVANESNCCHERSPCWPSISVPCSQARPDVPGLHTHLQLSPSVKTMPLFLQGWQWQGSLSDRYCSMALRRYSFFTPAHWTSFTSSDNGRSCTNTNAERS